MLEKTIENTLGDFQDPYLAKTWRDARVIKKIEILPPTLKLTVALPYPCADLASELQAAVQQYLAPVCQDLTIQLSLTSQIDPHVGKQGIAALPQVKNIIAVGSGKGGVGKSTVAVNLALALSQAGAKVGLLDADIYGPSQPAMLGAENIKPEIVDKNFMPILRHGLQTMSIGYLVQETSALVWRGPMIGKAMQQLIHDTRWENLDYLIVDLPPGTGDIQLTLCQKIPVTGAVIVTTPQDLALADVRRACDMFDKLSVPILGVVENMSVYHCPQCGHEAPIFGSGGGKKLQEEYNIDVLAQIPLSLAIREMTDSGQPPVAQQPESADTKLFKDAARKAVAKLATQPKDYSSRFPKIVVENK